MTTITVSDKIPDIIINGVSLYEEFGLISKIRPIISPPEPVTTIVDIPGSVNGPIDMTYSLTNKHVSYNDINGNLEFYIDFYKTDLSWKRIYNSILELTSKRVGHSNLILTDDPDWRYTGNIIFESFSTPSDGKPSTIKLKYRFRPWQEESNGEIILLQPSQIYDLSSYTISSYGECCSTSIFCESNVGGVVGQLNYQSLYFYDFGNTELDKTINIVSGDNYIPDFIIGRYSSLVKYVSDIIESNKLYITLRKRRI